MATNTTCFNWIKRCFCRIESVKWTLLFVVEVVKSSFKAITDIVRWVTLVFNEVIDFFKNIFSWNWKWALENLNNITAVW